MGTEAWPAAGRGLQILYLLRGRHSRGDACVAPVPFAERNPVGAGFECSVP